LPGAFIRLKIKLVMAPGRIRLGDSRYDGTGEERGGLLLAYLLPFLDLRVIV
jgi:hypothetical protein